jgi:diguanylate cyclase (GGDEF)-like protein/putative nucleotidyltransferase with HDIG domain
MGSFLMKTNVPPSSLMWNKVLQIGFVFVPVLLLRFSYILGRDYRTKEIVIVGYVIGVILVMLAFNEQVVKDAWYINNEFGYELAYGAYLVAVFGSFYSILALIVIIRKTTSNEIAFQRIKLVLIGLILVIIGGVLNISTTIGAYGIDILFNTINAFLITYSIYRNKFLEINLVVKKGLSFTVTNVVVYLIYASLILYGAQFIQMTVHYDSIFKTILILLPLFVFIEPTRNFVERNMKHLFYHNTIDLNTSLKEFSDLIHTSFDLETITGTLNDTIQRSIDAKEVRLLLKNKHVYQLYPYTNGLSETLEFSQNHPIVQWFDKENDLLLKSHIENHVLFKSMWQKEKDLLSHMKTEIIAPIKYQSELIGFISISERKDDNPYSFEETDFIKTIINNATAIIENAKTIEIIKQQSVTDELTKFYNHRYFQETVNQWIKDKVYHSFAIAMIDIDQFAIYNELYGHANGDIAIKRIADIIDHVIDEDFLKVRFGGEEFVVVMTNQTEKQALKHSEDIREAIEQEFLLSSDIREFLTVSVGLSFYPPHGSTLNELVNNATTAVSTAKKSGRNRVYIYQDNVEITEQDTEIQDKIHNAFASSIYALAATIDAKDHYTYGHSKNVALMSQLLAKKLGFDKKALDQIYNAGLLHDIGKVGIPEKVLSKPEVLTGKELELMKGHVVQSINIIKHIPELIDIVPIVISHHERYDGTGYPRKLIGTEIPELGRIIAIADSFDAMTTNRPYREGLKLEQAIYEMKKNKGKQFDPEYTDVFISLVENGELSQLELVNRSNLKN